MFNITISLNKLSIEMKEKDVIKKLKGFIYSEYGNQTAFAKANGFTPAYVNMVLQGKKPLTDNVLTFIGMKKVTTTEYVTE